MIFEAEHHTKLDAPWPWPNFTPLEMADRHNGAIKIDAEFMSWLTEVRRQYGKPMVVTSGYRTPEHQFLLSSTRYGAHVDARAVDIAVTGGDALRLIRIATDMKVLGLGVQQSGKYSSRFLHMDLWTNAPEGLRPTVWSY